MDCSHEPRKRVPHQEQDLWRGMEGGNVKQQTYSRRLGVQNQAPRSSYRGESPPAQTVQSTSGHPRPSTSTTVAKPATLRAVLALAAKHGYALKSGDIETAFLIAVLTYLLMCLGIYVHSCLWPRPCVLSCALPERCACLCGVYVLQCLWVVCVCLGVHWYLLVSSLLSVWGESCGILSHSFILHATFHSWQLKLPMDNIT